MSSSPGKGAAQLFARRARITPREVRSGFIVNFIAVKFNAEVSIEREFFVCLFS